MTNQPVCPRGDNGACLYHGPGDPDCTIRKATPYIRPFTDFLREQNQGQSADDLAAALRDLVARVKETGAAGTITYTIKVETMGPTDALAVTDKIVAKIPDRIRNGSVYFTDQAGNLLANDPNQLTALTVDPVTGEVTTPEPT